MEAEEEEFESLFQDPKTMKELEKYLLEHQGLRLVAKVPESGCAVSDAVPNPDGNTRDKEDAAHDVSPNPAASQPFGIDAEDPSAARTTRRKKKTVGERLGTVKGLKNVGEGLAKTNSPVGGRFKNQTHGESGEKLKAGSQEPCQFLLNSDDEIKEEVLSDSDGENGAVTAVKENLPSRKKGVNVLDEKRQKDIQVQPVPEKKLHKKERKMTDMERSRNPSKQNEPGLDSEPLPSTTRVIRIKIIENRGTDIVPVNAKTSEEDARIRAVSTPSNASVLNDESPNCDDDVKPYVKMEDDFEYYDGLSEFHVVNEEGEIKIEYDSDSEDCLLISDDTDPVEDSNVATSGIERKKKSTKRQDGMIRCSRCPRVFATRENAVEHLEKDHDSPCDECYGCGGKKFPNIVAHHQQYHMGSKTCRVCGMNFPNTIRANRHMLDAHREYLGLQNRKVNSNRNESTAPPKPLNVKEEYEKLFEETEVKPRTDLLDRKDFLISYDEALAGPDWTVEALDSSNAVKEKPEIFPPFIKDPELVSIQFSPRAMKMYPQYDTGHLAAAGNYYGKPEAFTDSFRMSNCRPMKKGFHRGVWTSLECFIREKLLLFWDKIIVYTGAIYDEKSKMKEAPGCVPLKIASYFYKALCLFREGEDEPQTLAFLIPHKNLYSGFCQFVCPVEKIECMVGFKFFPKFQDRSAWDFERGRPLSENLPPSSTLKDNRDVATPAEPVNTIADPDAFTCIFCNVQCGTFSDLEQHMNNHTHEKPIFCSYCDDEFADDEELKLHVKIAHDKVHVWLCAICNDEFSTETDCIEHSKKVHCGERKWICNECGKSFGKKSQLTLHKNVHLKKKPFKCHKCGKRFAQKRNLKYHDQNIHQKLKPHACKKCDKTFFNQRDLKAHDQGVHQKVKPYVCSECGKGFGYKSNRDDHVRAVHRNLRPHLCKHCGKSFVRKADLLIHDQAVHQKLKSHKCAKCEKRFFEKSALVKHDQAVHQKLKPYKCPKCGKRFFEKKALMNHDRAEHQKMKSDNSKQSRKESSAKT